MKFHIYLMCIALSLVLSYEIKGQGYASRRVAILDLTSRNNETDSTRTKSVRHIMQVTGVPFIETNNLGHALQYKILFIASRILEDTFSDSEIQLIYDYVYDGGTVITSNCTCPQLFNLFGIAGYGSDYFSRRFIWNVYSESNYFDRIEDDKEIFVSLGDTATTDSLFNHRFYYPNSGAEVLANYETNLPSLIKNEYGNGRTFVFGLDLRDVIIRNLLNRDLNAHRTYSSGFEPTVDTFIFFIQNVCRKHIAACVRWHTCPSCHDAVFMLTHDVDSNTAIDSLGMFLEYENNHNLNATYYQTVRYVNDDWMSDYYNSDNFPKIQNILTSQQKLGSHSVGHFPDFDSPNFPLGSIGNTMAEYTPYYLASNGSSTGGTAYGECEVSKFRLEFDFNVQIKSFRSGHLCYHDRLPKVLEDLGYLYNSSFSANDILTNFPFLETDTRSFSGNSSNIIGIPITLTDGSSSFPLNLDTYPSNVARWKSVSLKNAANSAPTVLLIHPNRGYKLVAEQSFFNQLPYGIRYMFLDDFGDYWRERLNSRLYSDYNPMDSTMAVFLMDFNPSREYAVVIDDYTDTSHCKFYDGFGNRLYPCSTPGPFNETRFCNFQYSNPNESYCNMPYTVHVANSAKKSIKIFPNPASDFIQVECNSEDLGKTIEIFDSLGNLILSKNTTSTLETINTSQLPSGLFTVRMSNSIYRIVIRKE